MTDKNSNITQRNAVLIVVGSAIMGTIVATVLPRSVREAKLLGPLGRQMRRRMKAAGQEAQDVAVARLDKLGINRESASAQARNLAEMMLETAALAGVAALRAARDKRAEM